VVVYSPQIVENYQRKSGEGLSVLFVVTWLLGDLCNLIGALMAGLLPTVIILAVYYSLCDVTLLYQIYYYRYTHPVHLVESTPAVVLSNEAGEESPLLASEPGLRKTAEHSSYIKAALRYLLAFAFVVATGIIAWLIQHNQDSDPDPRKIKDVIEWRSQVIGWTSALLYLGSRVPQILKNFETKCEGLSLALFMFAIAGNVTYVMSICLDSMGRKHLIANSSWLAGSGLTVFLDIFVLCQFFYFRSAEGRFVSEPASPCSD